MSAPQTLADVEAFERELRERAATPGLLDRRWLAPLAFVLTIVTVSSVGLDTAYEYFREIGVTVDVFDARVLVQMAIYASALIAILGTHEMGHWIVSRLHGVKTSLPVFIPIPFGIGTFGAVISMKELPRTRSTLLRIGAAGPLAGGVVAIALMSIALRHIATAPIPDESALGDAGAFTVFGDSLVTLLLPRAAIPAGQMPAITPLFFAAWTGLLLTSINLIPIGQLDGGHVFYALFGPRAAGRVNRVLPFAVMAMAIPSSLLVGGFSPSYLIWGLVSRTLSWHPPVPSPEPRLGLGDRLLAVACLLLLALTLMPVPMAIVFG